MSDATNEFEAISTIHGALEPLNDEARTRVLTYIANLLSINSADLHIRDVAAESVGGEDIQGRDTSKFAKQIQNFSTFAELYATANPKSNGEKALVAGYWLQECQGGDSFTGAAANKELTNLGHKLLNITDAVETMKRKKPMLILQIKKTGSGRQGRKLYKISQEGVNRVLVMVGG